MVEMDHLPAEHPDMFSRFFQIQHNQIFRQSHNDLMDEQNRRRRELDDEEAEHMRHRLVMSQAMVIKVAAAKKAEHERIRLASASK